MKITCGTDIIEIERIKESINSMQDKFINRVYTKKEIEYCEARNKQKYQHYAARFAGKEALFKAISPYLNDKYEIGWKDAEIINDSEGRPYVKLLKKIDGIEQIDISISHNKLYAIANVIIQNNN